jgi:hypothetical protein
MTMMVEAARFVRTRAFKNLSLREYQIFRQGPL